MATMANNLNFISLILVTFVFLTTHVRFNVSHLG